LRNPSVDDLNRNSSSNVPHDRQRAIWILHFDDEVAAPLVLIHPAQMAWEFLTDACDAGMQQQSPTSAFVWGNVFQVKRMMTEFRMRN
jgi:hypothetical protein